MFFFNFKVVAVIAQALLKSGFNATALHSAAQNETLSAILAMDSHFYAQKGTSIPDTSLTLQSEASR